MRKTGDVIILRKPKRQLAFVGAARRSSDAARRTGGEILVVFREGAGHVDPEGRILLMRSDDDGRSWSGPHVVADTDLDDRDPSIKALPDGRVVVNYFSSKCTAPWDEEHIRRWIGPEGYELGKRNWSAEVARIGLRFSQDGGQTWGDEVRIERKGVAVSASVCALRDGSLLLPIYGRLNTPNYAAYLMRSTDGGKSWGELELIASDPAGAMPFSEPTLLALPDGRLICQLRTTGAKTDAGAIWQTESSDGGRSWTPPRKLPLWGYRQSLALLSNGDVLSVYGYRRYPMGVRGAVSRDGGRSWDPAAELPIRWDGLHHDLGYPAAVPLEDGRAFVAYYINTTGDPFSYICGSWLAPS